MVGDGIAAAVEAGWTTSCSLLLIVLGQSLSSQEEISQHAAIRAL